MKAYVAMLTAFVAALIIVAVFQMVMLMNGCADNGAHRKPRDGGPGGGWYGVTTTTLGH